MKSLFNSGKEIWLDGVKYQIEADETVEGTQFFKVTNLEDGSSETCVRNGKTPKTESGMRDISDETLDIFEQVDEIDY